MAWNNTVRFNTKKGGSTKGMCLANTRMGFGINSKYPNAWTAWLKTQQHAGEQPPAGVDVPVFFSYKGDQNGHVGVRMANGKFWSDGKTYDSIAAYEAKAEPNYVGWGESINDVRILDYTPDQQPSDQNGWVGKTVRLSPNVSAWAFYRPGTPLPVNRRNRAGELNPKKWGGLSYRIEAVVAPNTVQVSSPSLGTIYLYLDGDAQVV